MADFSSLLSLDYHFCPSWCCRGLPLCRDGTDLGGHGRFLGLFSLVSSSSSFSSSLAAAGAAANRFSVTEFVVDRWITRRGPLGGVEDQLSSTFSGLWLMLRWIIFFWRLEHRAKGGGKMMLQGHSFSLSFSKYFKTPSCGRLKFDNHVGWAFLSSFGLWARWMAFGPFFLVSRLPWITNAVGLWTPGGSLRCWIWSTTNQPFTVPPEAMAEATETINAIANGTIKDGVILEKVIGPLSTGHLELQNTNPNDNPSVTFNYFKEPKDLKRCVKGMSTVIDVINSYAFSKFQYSNMTVPALTKLMLRSVLGTLASEPSETSYLPLALGFSEGESAMKKRKTGDEGVKGAKEQQALAVQGIFEAGSRLIETECLLNDSLIENDRLREVENMASARILEVESKHKTAEEGLQIAERQLVEISAKLERECNRSGGFQECNIHFLKGWVSALERAEVDDNSELYALGREYQPFNLCTPENLEEVIAEGLRASEAVEDPMGPEAVEVLRHQEQVLTEEVRDVEKGVSNKEDNVNVDDKAFTAKKIEFVEMRTVEHLLKKPCFIDLGGRPRAASVLLEYEPSYKSFKKGPIVKNFGQAKVTVARPGRSQEEIIEAVPVTARKGVQDVMRSKRKRGEEEDDEDEGGQELHLTEPFKKKSPSKKGKSKSARALRKAAGQPYTKDLVLNSGNVRNGQVADAVGKALLLPEDMRVWQEKRSKHMLENLKRHSILAVQGIFEASNQLLETERRLNQSQEEIKRLKDFEKSASAKIRVAESAHKSAEAGLMNIERQVTKLKEKLDREYAISSRLRVENNSLKDVVNEARAEVQKAEARVDDTSELYDLAPRHRPFKVDAPEERDGEEIAEDSTVPKPREVMNEPELAVDPEVAEDPGHLEADDQIRMVEVQEEEDDSDGEENVDVVD
uniref:Glucose-methanol-choline oxidoreductase C-terminal domain-containing protein n=1 Tax=Fagus sylvatica TaxID=28930 RepID=A0A2N9FVY1_FAGSY